MTITPFLQDAINVCITLGTAESCAHIDTRPNYALLYEIAESQAGFSWDRPSSNVRGGRFRRMARAIFAAPATAALVASVYASAVLRGIDTGRIRLRTRCSLKKQ